MGRLPSCCQRPVHPYTAGLISSVADTARPSRPLGIPGVAVGVYDRPPGCAFFDRCRQRVATCATDAPPLLEIQHNRYVRCPEWNRTPGVVRPDRELHRLTSEQQPLLQVDGLVAVHKTRAILVTAVDEVSFTAFPGECVALVGESGSGKTTLARCIAGLHAPASGSIKFNGTALARTARQRTRELRRQIQIVFQNPYDSLNPSHQVEQAVSRPLRLFAGTTGATARAEVEKLLELVRLPARLAKSYPRELSGGERQRVAIARALAAGPDLLLCDEITSALDVSVQAAILDLLIELQHELKLSMLFITHDLGVVASIADRILVLEAGVVRERGNADQVLSAPSAAYTRNLLDAIPTLPAATESV